MKVEPPFNYSEQLLTLSSFFLFLSFLFDGIK